MSRGTQYWPINFLSLECWQIFLIWSQEKLDGKPSVSHLRVLGDLFNGGKDNPTLPGGLGIIGSWNNPSPLMVSHFFSIVSFLPLAWFWSFSLLRPHFTRSKQQADPRAWPKSSRHSAECWPRAAGREWDRLTERSRALQQFRAWAARALLGPAHGARGQCHIALQGKPGTAIWAGKWAPKCSHISPLSLFRSPVWGCSEMPTAPISQAADSPFPARAAWWSSFCVCQENCGYS